MASAASTEAEVSPTNSIALSSALQCRAPEHIAVRVRFAPTRDLLAIVLQDYSFRSGRGLLPAWHVVLASRDGKSVRRLADEKLDRNDAFSSVFWSPDSDYIAFRTTKAVSLIRVEDGHSCRFAPERGGGPADSLGFIEGPRFVLNRLHKSNPTLEFYGTDCALAASSSSPSRSEGRVLPHGKYLAFRSGLGIILTDKRGEMPQVVDFQDATLQESKQDRPILRGYDPRWGVLKGGFAEGGSVLCSGFPIQVRCFNVYSGDGIGRPPVEELGPPVDTSVDASRGVWATPAPRRWWDDIFSLSALVEGKSWDRLLTTPGWLVWDYGAGAEILRLPPRSQRKSLYGVAFPQAVALAPKGDCLAVGMRDTVLMFELAVK